MKGLAKVLPKFPERVLRRKILQGLLDQTNDHALLPFTLPNVFYIVEKLTSKEFASLALPGLKPIFSVLDPPQTSIVLLDNISLLQKKVPGTVFRVDIMPLLYNALTSTQPQVQDKALQAVPNIAEFIDYTDLKDQLFPRIQHLYSKANVLSLKIRALMCLHGMLKSLDKNMIIDKLLPLLKRTKTREPGVIMTMLVMYEEIGLKYMDREMLAKEILPILWAQSVDTQLKLDQFKKFMQTIRRLSDRVENEQMKHLEQVRKIEVQTSRSGGGSGGDGLGMDFSIEQEDGDIGGGGGGGGGGGFASLVMNKSDGNILVNPLASADLNGKQANVLQNPLASVASPATSPKPSSGWEWDASTFESNALAPSTTTNGNGAKSGSSLAFGKTIPVDYTSSSINGDDDDDFGSFGSFVPPPPPSSLSTAQRPGGNTPVTSTLAAKQVSARLRTTTTGFQPTQGRLGATRLQSQSTTANAFSATLPKPPSSNTGQAKPNYSLNANAFASTPVIQPMSQTSSTSRPSFGSTPVLTPSISKKHQSSNSQSHAGGKSAHLGDFDPFA
ncbi:Protein kinase domain-containing protein ppk32 [Dipsacomyces acuminosporus]|nr:Protein kinase domain-containing protein ppk32 [Dipsacomyces acuminosporus]